jgi:CHAD domain-containing protein
MHSHSGLLKYLHELTAKLRAYFSSSSRGGVMAIHAARVAARRMRGALPLFEEHLPRKQGQAFKRSLKRIRRTLGRVRDLDVIGERLAGFGASHAEAVAFILKRLRLERRERLAKIKALNEVKLLESFGNWLEVKGELVAEHVRWQLHQALRSQLQGFCEMAGHFSAENISSSETAGRSAGSMVNAHQLRISGKALRYLLEMAQADGAPIGPQAGEFFKRVQGLLGEWHDLVILADKAIEESKSAQLNYTNSELFLKCLKLAEAAIYKSGRCLASFAWLWRKDGGELHRKIEAALDTLSDANLNLNLGYKRS